MSASDTAPTLCSGATDAQRVSAKPTPLATAAALAGATDVVSWRCRLGGGSMICTSSSALPPPAAPALRLTRASSSACSRCGKARLASSASPGPAAAPTAAAADVDAAAAAAAEAAAWRAAASRRMAASSWSILLTEVRSSRGAPRRRCEASAQLWSGRTRTCGDRKARSI